jgi:hypothetical protein
VVLIGSSLLPILQKDGIRVFDRELDSFPFLQIS